MNDGLHALLVIAVSLPAIVIVSWLAARLLGTRRGWVAILVAGTAGWIGGNAAAFTIADFDASDDGLVRNLAVFAVVLTMAVMVTLDLVAPPGSLARGDEAGLFVFPRPVREVRDRLGPLKRFREVVQALRANGFGPAIGLGRDTRSADLREPAPVRLRHALEQCGGMFVKLGQVASTRPDLVPPAYAAELAQLRSAVAPAPADEMRAVVEAELGRPVEEAFAAFEWEPVAAASIAHAYRARLHSGEDVIVKVQRPGVDALVRRDTAALVRLATMVEARTPRGRQLHVASLAQEFADGLRAELDFTIEASNAAAIAAATDADAGVRIPAVYEEFTTARLLVQEHFTGTSIADQDRVREVGVPPRELADRLLRALLGQILRGGTYHADPHPGNVLLLDDGSIGLIDFGAVGNLDPALRASLLTLMVGAQRRDAELLRRGLEDAVDLPADVDERALQRALGQFLATHLRPGQGISAAALQDLLPILGHFRIRVVPELATVLRAVATLEGTLRTIEPGFSLADAAERLAGDAVALPQVPDDVEQLALQELAAQLPTLRKLPARFDRLTALAERGELRVRHSLFATDADQRFGMLLANRIALAILASGAAIASVALVATHAGPPVSGSASLGELLGAAGLAGASVLGLRVVAQAVRDGA